MFLLRNKRSTTGIDEEILRDTIIDNIPAQIFWKNTELTYLGCNKAFIEALGLNSKKDVIGKTDYDLPVSEIDSSGYRADDMEVIKTRKAKLHIEEQQTFKDGSKKILSTSKVPLFDDAGNVYGVLAIYIDITHRKKIELDLVESRLAAETANQAKTEFLENMRHDIRTPLTGIVGFSDLLMMETEDPRVQEYAENLVASSHALLYLLDEVLEAVRVSSGEIPLQKKKFHLAKTLSHIIELNRARAGQKRLDLSIKIDPSLPRYVIGDKIRLHRIVLELIANALNFTDTGFVQLSIAAAQRDNQKLILKICVADSGIGIPKDKQEEIYLHFKRLSPSYKGLHKGTGLGLAVVKQFVDELCGEIYVNSESGIGTTFTCIIPLQIPLLDDACCIGEEDDNLLFERRTRMEKSYASMQTNEPLLASSHRVLLVEDNVLAQLAAKTILLKENMSVDIAKSGEEAFACYLKKEYDLIFMDIGLPDKDGYQITQLIRADEKNKRKLQVPIIALTAHVGEENQQRCMQVGMNAVVAKPLSRLLCKELLNSYLATPDKSTLHKPMTNEDLFALQKYPIFDVQIGIKTFGSDKILRKLLKNTVSDCFDPDLIEIKAAYADHDWLKIKQITHRIKGGAIYIGAVQLQKACSFLEQNDNATQSELREKLYAQLIEIMRKTKEVVLNWSEQLFVHSD